MKRFTFVFLVAVPLLAGCPEETKPTETVDAHASAAPVVSQAAPPPTATVAATPDASVEDAGKDAGKTAPKK
jgi:hypothetical protein